jgi:hypothetical protein
MELTSEQVVERIASRLKINVETLSLIYFSNPQAKNHIDECLDDINSRRVKNGLEPVIIKKHLVD